MQSWFFFGRHVIPKVGFSTGRAAAALTMRPVPHVDYLLNQGLPVSEGAIPAPGHALERLWRGMQRAMGPLEHLRPRRSRADRVAARRAAAESEEHLRRLHDVGISRDEHYSGLLRRI